MLTVKDWLAREVPITRQTPRGLFVKKVKIVERFAELIAVNNGQMDVERFNNVVPTTKHPYLRLGLTLQEAMELQNWAGMYTGILYAYDATPASEMNREGIKLIKDEIARIEKEGFDPYKDATPIDSSGNINPPITIYSEKDLKEIVKVEKEVNKMIR